MASRTPGDLGVYGFRNRADRHSYDTVAAAMIDRLVHHAEVIALKGDSYRLKNRDLGRVPATTADES